MDSCLANRQAICVRKEAVEIRSLLVEGAKLRGY